MSGCTSTIIMCKERHFYSKNQKFQKKNKNPPLRKRFFYNYPMVFIERMASFIDKSSIKSYFLLKFPYSTHSFGVKE